MILKLFQKRHFLLILILVLLGEQYLLNSKSLSAIVLIATVFFTMFYISKYYKIDKLPILIYLFFYNILFKLYISNQYYKNVFSGIDGWSHYSYIIGIINNQTIHFDSIIKTSGFMNYPNFGYHTFYAINNILTSTINNITFNIIILSLLSFISVYVVYTVLKEYDIRFALFCSFLTIFGLEGFWAKSIYLTPASFALLVIIPSLIFIDYLSIHKKRQYILIRSILYLTLLQVHLWSSLVYLLYYIFYSTSLLVMEKKLFKKVIIEVISLSCIFTIFSYPVIIAVINKLQIFNIFALIIGLIILVLSGYYIIYKNSSNIKKILSDSSKLNIKHLIIPATIFILFIMYYIGLNRTMQIFTIHFPIIIFIILALIGLKSFISDSRLEARFIILAWAFINTFLFIIISFAPLIFGSSFNIIFIDALRHISLISIVVMPLIFFIVLTEKHGFFKKHKYFVFLSIAILIISSGILVPAHNIKQSTFLSTEIESIDWITKNTGTSSVFSVDYRLARPLYLLGNRIPVWDSRTIFKEPLNSTELNRYLKLTDDIFGRKVTVDYVYWSDYYTTYIQFHTEYNANLTKKDQDKFENSNMFDKVYTNKDVTLYKVFR